MHARKVAEAALPSRFGEFRIFGFETAKGGEGLIALVLGDLSGPGLPLVRIHSQCLTGDLFGSYRCDCGAQLETALERISQEGRGVLLYQLAEGRGIGLMNKLAAYQLQDAGHDTVEANHQLGFEADLRSYALCAEVLQWFGLRGIRLMSNNPHKLSALEEAGIERIERVPIEIPPSENSKNYLRTKKEKLGHLLTNL